VVAPLVNSAAATLADEPLTDPRGTATADTAPRDAGSSRDVEPGMQQLRAALAEFGADASRVVEVESLRLRAAVDRKLSRWLAFALLALMGLAALGMSGVLLARGLSGALSALFGGPEWLGPLLVGLALPALAVMALQVLRARRARSRIARARELAAREDVR